MVPTQPEPARRPNPLTGGQGVIGAARESCLEGEGAGSQGNGETVQPALWIYRCDG